MKKKTYIAPIETVHAIRPLAIICASVGGTESLSQGKAGDPDQPEVETFSYSDEPYTGVFGE